MLPPALRQYGSASRHGANRGGSSASSGDVMDVHGAGAQRSDPKTGDPSSYPVYGHGPQGDMCSVSIITSAACALPAETHIRRSTTPAATTQAAMSARGPSPSFRMRPEISAAKTTLVSLSAETGPSGENFIAQITIP